MTESAAFPSDAHKRLTDYLATHYLPAGLGTKEAACSLAAINLALTGELTDSIPACMSEVIGRWIVCIQDAMPDNLRNSFEWKSLLSAAAGTGRDREGDRLALILEWMWADVLLQLSDLADRCGFGAAWQTMLAKRTIDAANVAAAAAYAANAANAAAYAAANAAANAAAYAADADAAAAANAANAANAAAYAAANAANAANAAAYAAANAANAAKFWAHIDPVGLLSKLIQVV